MSQENLGHKLYNTRRLLPVDRIRVYVSQHRDTEWEYGPVRIELSDTEINEFRKAFEEAFDLDMNNFLSSLPGVYEEREAVKEELVSELEKLKVLVQRVNVSVLDTKYGEQHGNPEDEDSCLEVIAFENDHQCVTKTSDMIDSMIEHLIHVLDDTISTFNVISVEPATKIPLAITPKELGIILKMATAEGIIDTRVMTNRQLHEAISRTFKFIEPRKKVLDYSFPIEDATFQPSMKSIESSIGNPRHSDFTDEISSFKLRTSKEEAKNYAPSRVVDILKAMSRRISG